MKRGLILLLLLSAGCSARYTIATAETDWRLYRSRYVASCIEAPEADPGCTDAANSLDSAHDSIAAANEARHRGGKQKDTLADLKAKMDELKRRIDGLVHVNP